MIVRGDVAGDGQATGRARKRSRRRGATAAAVPATQVAGSLGNLSPVAGIRAATTGNAREANRGVAAIKATIVRRAPIISTKMKTAIEDIKKRRDTANAGEVPRRLDTDRRRRKSRGNTGRVGLLVPKVKALVRNRRNPGIVEWLFKVVVYLFSL